MPAFFDYYKFVSDGKFTQTYITHINYTNEIEMFHQLFKHLLLLIYYYRVGIGGLGNKYFRPVREFRITSLTFLTV